MVKYLDHFGRNCHDFLDWTAICDEVSKTLNQRLTVYRLRAWLLDVVCDILIVALSLMSVGIWLVNNYEQNELFSSWTRCNHYQMETHNDRSGLLDNNSCNRNTWSLCTDSELGGSTRYWVGRSFDAALCWLVNKNTSWAVLLITNALFSLGIARLQSNVDVQLACWTTTETKRPGHWSVSD